MTCPSKHWVVDHDILLWFKNWSKMEVEPSAGRPSWNMMLGHKLGLLTSAYPIHPSLLCWCEVFVVLCTKRWSFPAYDQREHGRLLISWTPQAWDDETGVKFKYKNEQTRCHSLTSVWLLIRRWTEDCLQIFSIKPHDAPFVNVCVNLYEYVLTWMCSCLCWIPLGSFSSAVNSHTASFPSRGMENDDRKALVGRATFIEKWLHRF